MRIQAGGSAEAKLDPMPHVIIDLSQSCTHCRKHREAAVSDDVDMALSRAEEELGFVPQAGATTSANAALTAAAMAAARHKRSAEGPS